MQKAKNNLFGLNAVDSNQMQIHSRKFWKYVFYAAKFLSENYLAIGNWRYNGAVLGNE
ncbi:hypothetical protein KHA80_12785 [Anaerobacillus sp. HL2]|nr:hypothetical protein KHA80_12785 [Anaerobacillus sp. HL2]